MRPKKGLEGLKIGPVCPLIWSFQALDRSDVKGSNRPTRPKAGLQGFTELGLAGRESDFSPGMQIFWVHQRPFSTKIRAHRPQKGLTS